MKKTLTIALCSIALFAVGCVDHSEDFQSTAPPPMSAPPAAAPQAVTPAATQSTAVPATTMP